jgi:hypothetical protein
MGRYEWGLKGWSEVVAYYAQGFEEASGGVQVNGQVKLVLGKGAGVTQHHTVIHDPLLKFGVSATLHVAAD